jgi:5-methyltetrahydrofolate--homocysteine methyltransferase
MEFSNVMLKDTLRYIQMPASDIDETTIQKIKNTYGELEKISLIKHIYNCFDVSLGSNTVFFEKAGFEIESIDLANLLMNCSKCYVLAVTLGQTVDRQINIQQKRDMFDALILDACASVLVDKICDDIEQSIIKDLNKNEFLTMRFSPGYGDVPLDIQQQLIDVLDASKRIGLSLTKTNMLIPTKSVTAFIGVSHQRENRNKTCKACNLVHECIYKERGDKCGV